MDTETAARKSIYEGDETDTQELTGAKLPKSRGLSQPGSEPASRAVPS